MQNAAAARELLTSPRDDEQLDYTMHNEKHFGPKVCRLYATLAWMVHSGNGLGVNSVAPRTNTKPLPFFLRGEVWLRHEMTV